MSNATIELPSDLVERLNERVASGASGDTAEAIRDGLTALEAEDTRRLEVIRARVAAAIADPAPSIPAEQVFDRISAMLDSLPRK